MQNTTTQGLKQDVKSYWNKQSCGTDVAVSEKFSRSYFEEIEEHRYRVEEEIMPFAQFTRWHGKKVLEAGVGAGTDFLQWVRAGAIAHGIDLTEEGIAHVQHRLEVYGLQCEDLRVGDAENIPHQDNYFDLVYSWGVIHHSPDTLKALGELVRVARPGGRIKVMVYNRRSPYVVYKYLRWGLFAGKPFKSIKSIMAEHQESPGTKAYTIKEMRKILAGYPVKIISIDAPATYYDLLPDKSAPARWGAYILTFLFGLKKCGWFLRFEVEKKGGNS